MKHLHSILVIRDPQTRNEAVVVCETQQDEKDVLRHVANRRDIVMKAIPSEEGKPITLNDYEFA